ncbi:ion transporter [Chamaesiphon minutus]|uniref:Kef-type K+ ransport system, predicted NAD-binding component n=1 Tax=Chamaesiphon minutus (strain ATCC 27169 / PCC 6605) TaxID=1173020 RepID=K9UHG3_CHAP6|nr:ion transporter [Chamaesiphon minutus]AFY94088.1 Kef-type K+ ransport system, predicted NAD-binding component [Chamaesiphon minutus PCC 6605]
MIFADKISLYLEDIEHPIGKAVNLAIAGLVVVSTGIFIAETYPLSSELRSIFERIDSIVLYIFTIEYLLRFITAQDKLKYLFSFYSLIDLIAILPMLTGITDVSFIRILRWFRILRLLRFIEGKTLLGNLDREDSSIVTRILFTIFSIIFIYSGLIYQVEHPVNPKFDTFFDAVYFAVVTMTTVGFGDITPISNAGKFMTVLMILSGIALIPWQLGDLIKQVAKSANKVNAACPNCQLSSHDLDANFCKRCGTKLH